MINKNLKKFFEDNKILIPSYQRVYTWGKFEIMHFLKDLIEDIDNGIKSNFGVIYYDIHSKDNSSYQIIDGQQRLTTSALIISTIAIKRASSEEAKAFAKTILNRKIFSSEIDELKNTYAGYYDFLKFAFELRSKIDEIKFEDIIIKYNEFVDENKKHSHVEVNDLLSAMKTINEILDKKNFNQKDSLQGSNFTSNNDWKNIIVKQLFSSEFFLIENPYKNDPVTIFERLNNRGKELSFISMSKIKVYEFFEKKARSNGIVKSQEIAQKYMLNYSELMYSIFKDSSNSLLIETKDEHLEKTMVEYLEVTTNSVIPNYRIDKLKYFNEFLESDYSKIVSTKDDLEKFNSVIKTYFAEFINYSSVRLLKPKSGDYDITKRVEKVYYLNGRKKEYKSENLCLKPKVYILNAIKKLDDLDDINLKKFKNITYYILSDLIKNPTRKIPEEDSEEIKVKKMIDYVLKWTALNYVHHTKLDFDVTFREDMKLNKFIKKYLDNKNDDSKLKLYLEYFEKEIEKIDFKLKGADYQKELQKKIKGKDFNKYNKKKRLKIKGLEKILREK